MNKGSLVLLGSGETAPGMTKVHREVLTRLDEVRGVNLDTAYAFQENVPQMTEKLLGYFQTSLHVSLEPLHFASYANADDLERTIFKQRVRDANYVFAGPGSPSYALTQWAPLDLQEDLTTVLANDGAVCFASAAALTIGAFTAPIYEIYKVGQEPFWLDGLNLTAALGLNCVVIPHYDNNEGANYDTRFCYLGERRLTAMEAMLPPEVATLGVDEHTALILDLASDSVRVLGRSHGYWRHGGRTTVLENGSSTPLDTLRSIEPTEQVIEVSAAPTATGDSLELGKMVASGGAEAMEALARLVDLAGRATTGGVEVEIIIDGLLKTRDHVRSNGDYELADELRDLLLSAGVEIHDSPTGSSWTLR